VTYTIRQATLDDRPALCELSKELYEASPYARTPFNHDHIWTNLTTWLTSDKNERIAIVVVAEGGEIAGFILGFTVPAVFNTFKIAYELAWWTSPNHTKRNIAIKLVEAYEWWAQKVGCSYVSMARFYDHPAAKKIDEKLEERGYKPTEKVFMKALD
jgi:hypothetical protein